MAGRNGKNITPQELEDRSEAILIAIELGSLSYGKIAKATELTIQNIQTVFKHRPEVHREYKKAQMAVRAMAESNIVDAIMDVEHPKNFEASKVLLNRYKWEMDDALERDNSDIEVEVSNAGGGKEDSLVKISFSSQSKQTLEEESE